MKTTAQTNLANKVQSKFRDLKTEQQLMAYFLKVNPQGVLMTRREWFSNEALGMVYDVLRDKRAKLPARNMYEEIKARHAVRNGNSEVVKESLKALYSTKVDMDQKGARVLMEQVMRLYDSRRLVEGVGGIVTTLDQFDLDKAVEKVRVFGTKTSLSDLDREGMYLDDYDQRVEIMKEREARLENSDGQNVGIPTGIIRFDDWTGGLLPGEFGVIMGTSGVGKTLAMLNFGLHAWKQGYNVVIVSAEMDKPSMEFRIDSNLAGIEAIRFRKAELEDEDYSRWDRTIAEQRLEHTNNYLYVAAMDRKHFTADAIRGKIMQVQEDTGKKVDLLCVDYLNLMDSSKAGHSGDTNVNWERQSDAVWDLKTMVEDLGLVCWTGTQVVDAAYSKELFDISDIKYSRAIGQAAPIIVALICTPADEIDGTMKLQVLKLRSAGKLPRYAICLTPQMAYQRIHVESPILGRKSIGDISSGWVDITKNGKGGRRKPKPSRLEEDEGEEL